MTVRDGDLLVIDGDLQLSAGAQTYISARGTIEQDIRHMLVEMPIVKLLVAERDAGQRAAICQRIAIEIAEDERIVPGTVSVLETEPGRIYLTGASTRYGPMQPIALEALA